MITKSFLSIICLLFALPFQTTAQEWELEKDKADIQVFTKKVEGSAFKAYRAVMEMQTTVAALDKLMRDQEAMTTWFDRCLKCEQLKQVSENEFYIYFVNDGPWPVQDRDNISHAIFEYREDGGLLISLTGVADYLPTKKNLVRLPVITAHWEFQPLANGKVKIVQQAHIDLGGSVPGWVANLALVDSPFNTMVNLRKTLRERAKQ